MNSDFRLLILERYKGGVVEIRSEKSPNSPYYVWMTRFHLRFLNPRQAFIFLPRVYDSVVKEKTVKSSL
jgi:hypothetical protein